MSGGTMSPRKPPPLPRSLFETAASSSSPLRPPAPTDVHPTYIVDAHYFQGSSPSASSSSDNNNNNNDDDTLFDKLPERYPRPAVRHVVQAKMEVSANPATSVYGVRPFSIHPTILNLTLVTPPSITNIAKGAVDIIVPSSQPMTVREWDLLEEAVNALDGSWGAREHEAGGGKIVISGILPPPLTVPSSALAKDDLYNLHLGRIAHLSLHANVYLKVLPPVVENIVETWYDDQKELDRVLKMYLTPAIDAFGFHRLVFGSSPALPGPHLGRRTRPSVDLIYPHQPSEWYNALRRNLTELGADRNDVSQIMCENALQVYRLDDGTPPRLGARTP